MAATMYYDKDARLTVITTDKLSGRIEIYFNEGVRLMMIFCLINGIKISNITGTDYCIMMDLIVNSKTLVRKYQRISKQNINEIDQPIQGSHLSW